MERISRVIVAACALAACTSAGRAQVMSIPNLTVPNVTIDFDNLVVGPTSVPAINSAFLSGSLGLNGLVFDTRTGTGLYNFQTGLGNALGAFDPAGSLEVIPVNGNFQNADRLHVFLPAPSTQFGFGIGDWSGPFNAELLLNGAPVGTLAVSTVSDPGPHFLESPAPFDEVILTALPQNPVANWVVPLLFIQQFFAAQESAAFYGTTTLVSFESSTQYLSVVSRRLESWDGPLTDRSGRARILRCRRHDPCDAWVSGYGSGGDIAGSGGISGVDYAIGGTAFGIDRWVTPRILLGVSGGYSATGIRSDTGIAASDFDSYYLTLYGRHDSPKANWFGVFGYGHHNYDVSRSVGMGMTSAAAGGEQEGDEFLMYIERGGKHQWRDWQVTPLIGVQVIALRQDRVTETGTMPLEVAGRSSESLRLSAGLRLIRPKRSRKGRLWVPLLSVRYAHEFLDDQQSFLFTPLTGGAPFVGPGLDVGRDRVVLDAGFTCHPSRHVRTFANYHLESTGHLTSHTGSGGIQLLW